MGKLLGLRQDIEMERGEDGVFRPTARVWVTTPDGRLCEGDGPTIILEDRGEADDWYTCLHTLRTDFDEAEDGVRALGAMDPDAVAALAEAARRIVDEET